MTNGPFTHSKLLHKTIDATGVGGGAYSCALNNCILYFNTAVQGVNHDSSVLNYCCTTPQPTNGVGNISTDPQLASASHLSAGSPCRGAGNVGGPLSVAITASFTNVVVGFPVQLTARINGLTTSCSLEFGDGASATNQPYMAHAWTVLGNYPVVLRAYNESQPGGISATVIVHVVTQPVHYVAADSGNPIPPFTSWSTAATNIQDAVDAAAVPWALVLVTNGLYSTRGRAVYGTPNRLVSIRPSQCRVSTDHNLRSLMEVRTK
jgi:hypothetical protein